MWVAKNKTGELRLFELPPRRFHAGPMLEPSLVGFNDAITVGNDEYSFWAVQEFYESNRIDDLKHYGLRLKTQSEENGQTVCFEYVPESLDSMDWEDEPVEVEIIVKK